MSKKGLLLVTATAIISGISIFINKFAVSFSNPSVFAFLKNLMVGLILFGIIIFWKKIPQMKKLEAKDWVKLLVIGLVGGCIPFLLFFKGLAMTSAAESSFIQKTMFVFVAILAVYCLKEKLSKSFFIGSLFLLLGNLLILKNLNLTFGKGDVLILVATIFWAIENIISKKALEKIDSEIVAWGRMFFGSVSIFIYLFISGQAGLILKIDIQQIGWIALTSAFLFGYVLTWYRGLKKIPVSIATSVLLLGSPITTFLSWLNGAVLSSREIFSVISVSLGIFLILEINYFYKKTDLRRNHYERNRA